MTIAKLPQRKIGDASVPAIGFGCMSLAILFSQYNVDAATASEESCLDVLTAAADTGFTFWVTSSAYGISETLLGKWFAKTGRRKEIFLATKFGGLAVSGKDVHLSSKPEDVIAQCAKSLEALQTDYIDLYLQHRVDPATPIEKTVEAMVQLKQEGKIHYLGLSECSSRTLQRASAIHPIAAAEMEYSPFAMEIESPETEFLKTARELGTKIIAYAPLGKGFFTGTIKKREDLPETDFRRFTPRFAEENFDGNLKLVEEVGEIARQKGCTPSQLVLAWILFQGEDFIPLPGTKTIKYVQENARVFDVEVTKEDDEKIRAAIDRIGGTKGARYPPHLIQYCFGDSVELDK